MIFLRKRHFARLCLHREQPNFNGCGKDLSNCREGRNGAGLWRGDGASVDVQLGGFGEGRDAGIGRAGGGKTREVEWADAESLQNRVGGIECGGVGYKCLATMNTLRSLPAAGENAMLYTQMLVREDAVELCGFATTAERNCFVMLMSISGVGAKVALAILSVLTPEQVALAVSLGDSKTLTKASGVGSKLAQRIILELKDKIKKLGITTFCEYCTGFCSGKR